MATVNVPFCVTFAVGVVWRGFARRLVPPREHQPSRLPRCLYLMGVLLHRVRKRTYLCFPTSTSLCSEYNEKIILTLHLLSNLDQRPITPQFYYQGTIFE